MAEEEVRGDEKVLQPSKPWWHAFRVSQLNGFALPEFLQNLASADQQPLEGKAKQTAMIGVALLTVSTCVLFYHLTKGGTTEPDSDFDDATSSLKINPTTPTPADPLDVAETLVDEFFVWARKTEKVKEKLEPLLFTDIEQDGYEISGGKVFRMLNARRFDNCHVARTAGDTIIIAAPVGAAKLIFRGDIGRVIVVSSIEITIAEVRIMFLLKASASGRFPTTLENLIVQKLTGMKVTKNVMPVYKKKLSGIVKQFTGDLKGLLQYEMEPVFKELFNEFAQTFKIPTGGQEEDD